ncbi:MAG: tRNA pseudouridine(38-40) synthase TruA [Promethearchaeota archaeon]
MNGNRYLFKFFYIGENYHGSQRQLNHNTVEECIINALMEKKYMIDFGNSGFEVASRTDRHVSARGGAFSFITKKSPILMEINSVLPKDIGIWAQVKVPQDFSSRYNAEFRHYKYVVLIDSHDSNMDLDIMRKACKELEGRHDFTNFSKKEKKDEVITLRDLMVSRFENHENFLIFDFKSRAFLRQQIRRMMAKILELGKNLISYDDFLQLFDPSKEYSYKPAEPNGLILWDVNYGHKLRFERDNKSVKRMKTYLLQHYRDFYLKSRLFHIMEQDDLS